MSTVRWCSGGNQPFETTVNWSSEKQTAECSECGKVLRPWHSLFGHANMTPRHKRADEQANV